MTPQHLAVIGGRLDSEDPTGMLGLALANDLADRGLRVTLLAPAAIDFDLDERVTLLTPESESRWLWISLLNYRRWVAKTIADRQPDHTLSLFTTIPADILVPTVGDLSARIKATRLEPTAIHERLAKRLSLLLPSIALSRHHEKRTLSSEAPKTVIALSPMIESDVQASPLHASAAVRRAYVPIPDQPTDVPSASLTRSKLARAWGLSPEAYWITLPFRCAGLGGLEPMIRAFKPLIEQGVDAVLLLAGPTRYTHLAWIAQLGVRDRVRFVGKTARMQQLVAASDLVASPTSYDPAGWIVRPALTLHKPIITTAACDLADLVRQQGGTVLDAPAEPLALLQAIREHHADWQQGQTPRYSPQTPADPSLTDAVAGLLEG